MLQDIRKSTQGTAAKIIIGLIVISFSIFGIESLLFSGGSNAIAEVNGEEISPFTVQEEVSLMQRQLLGMLGENADPALLDQGMLTEQAMQSIIQRVLLKQAAVDLQLTVPDPILSTILGSMEQFQVDGQFSADLYQSLLAGGGFTPGLFSQRLSDDVLQSQLRAGLAGSDFVTEVELRSAARVAAEGRDLRYITLPLDLYRDTASVEPEAIRAYYDNNADAFMSEETLLVEYLELTADAYREAVDEDRLREEFELVRDEFEQAEEARVSHILFEGSEGEREQRLLAVQEALTGGMSFTDAAQEFSDDIGSSSAGGDLGYTAGDAFPESMETAITELTIGETGSVETDAGTHLLLVTDRRAGTAVTFAEVRGELEQRTQDADASIALLSDVERLRDIVFNAADLTGPADELDLEIQSAAGITQGTGQGVFVNPRLLQAAFSEDVLEAGHNSEVIELAADHYLVMRVAQRDAPAVRPFAEVRSPIERDLREQQALADAQIAATGMLTNLRAGVSVESLANEAGLDWQVELGARRSTGRLDTALRTRLFELAPPDADGAPVLDIVEAGETLFILELTRVTAGSLEAMTQNESQSLSRRLAAENATALLQQYEAALQANADITVY